MGCVCVYKQKIAQRYWWEHGDEKTRKNSLDEKRFFSLCFFSCKTLEQKFIFPIGTLNPHGINERFPFN